MSEKDGPGGAPNDPANADEIHWCKRLWSYDLMDEFLDGCAQGRCPNLAKEDLQYLIDISVNGYVKQKALRMSEANQGSDDKHRYYQALARAQAVLRCSINPTFPRDLFDADERDLASNPAHREGARKRKAYWRYMDREGGEGSLTDHDREDFCDACGFLNSVHSAPGGKASPPNPDDWERNFDIVNAIDLYRFCLQRKLSAAG